ncbi:MAG TPA: RING finger protein [Pirellulaceae bacterium]|nr:RING finger protein [Pirellulaceae bacterium]
MDLLAQAHRGESALAALYLLSVFGLVALVALLAYWGWRASFRQKLEQVARHLHGRVVSRGELFADFAEIHFEHEGYPAAIRFSPRGRGSYYTHVEIRWNGPRVRCEIYPESFLSGLRKLMGMQDIVIGSPRFDSAFVITGDDEPAIKALLNGHVQTAIFHLAGYVSGIHVQMGSRSLLVTCAGLVSEFARLVELERLCRELCDAAIAAQGHGIEFLEGMPAAMKLGDGADAHCMVCGETLDSQVVYCRSCKTPHHRDCWTYGGGCSTYGCGEKKFVSKA